MKYIVDFPVFLVKTRRDVLRVSFKDMKYASYWSSNSRNNLIVINEEDLVESFEYL